jgi:AcrR family transcriptional regulator
MPPRGRSGGSGGGRGGGGRAARLSPEDWVGAALEAIAAGGLVAVAVEPVAARLGATKGSFYWHFANRDELVVAALLAWEQRDTIDVIAELEAIPVPAVRLRTLFLRAFGTTAVGSVEAALLADAPSPLVAPVLERVTLRRLEYAPAPSGREQPTRSAERAGSGQQRGTSCVPRNACEATEDSCVPRNAAVDEESR